MIEPIQNKIIFIRLGFSIFGIMIAFKFFDPNNFRNMYKDRNGQPLPEMEEFQEEVAYKLLL